MPSTSTEFRKYRTRQGVALAADVGGDPAGPAVILLHGGGQTRHSWGSAFAELVAHGYHVINLEARGHGDSDWSSDGLYGNEEMSHDLADVIETLRSAPALVGASMGGAAALLATGGPRRSPVSALVLVDIVPRVEIQGAERIIGFMNAHRHGFDTLEEAADAVAGYRSHRRRPRDLRGLMKNLRRRDDGRLYWHWDPRILDRFDGPAPPQPADLLEQAASQVKAPSLLVRGLQSDVVSERGIAQLRVFMPQLEVVDVRAAGHMVAGDRNDAFNRSVISFLHRHTASGRIE